MLFSFLDTETEFSDSYISITQQRPYIHVIKSTNGNLNPSNPNWKVGSTSYSASFSSDSLSYFDDHSCNDPRELPRGEYKFSYDGFFSNPYITGTLYGVFLFSSLPFPNIFFLRLKKKK
jgi:hypothetical protein